MRTVRFAAICLLAARLPGAIDVPGAPDFHQVDANVYRGRQPSAEGFKNLAKLGIRTVIDLRGGPFHLPREKKQVEDAGMRYVEERFSGVFPPRNEQVARLIAVMQDPTEGPVFVHCRRGADRVGVLIACYRMVQYHWTNQQALAEARAMKLSFLEPFMQRYIRSFDPATYVRSAPSHPAPRPSPSEPHGRRP